MFSFEVTNIFLVSHVIQSTTTPFSKDRMDIVLITRMNELFLKQEPLKSSKKNDKYNLFSVIECLPLK